LWRARVPSSSDRTTRRLSFNDAQPGRKSSITSRPTRTRAPARPVAGYADALGSSDSRRVISIVKASISSPGLRSW